MNASGLQGRPHLVPSQVSLKDVHKYLLRNINTTICLVRNFEILFFSIKNLRASHPGTHEVMETEVVTW